MRRPGSGTALQHTRHSKETREYSCFFLRITKRGPAGLENREGDRQYSGNDLQFEMTLVYVKRCESDLKMLLKL